VVRLDRRTLVRLETKRPKVVVGRNGDEPDPLEEYYQALENYELAQQGLPPIHHIPERYDPMLKEYFAELDQQAAERDAALQRREHNGHR